MPALVSCGRALSPAPLSCSFIVAFVAFVSRAPCVSTEWLCRTFFHAHDEGMLHSVNERYVLIVTAAKASLLSAGRIVIGTREPAPTLPIQPTTQPAHTRPCSTRYRITQATSQHLRHGLLGVRSRPRATPISPVYGYTSQPVVQAEVGLCKVWAIK